LLGIIYTVLKSPASGQSIGRCACQSVCLRGQVAGNVGKRLLLSPFLVISRLRTKGFDQARRIWIEPISALPQYSVLAFEVCHAVATCVITMLVAGRCVEVCLNAGRLAENLLIVMHYCCTT